MDYALFRLINGLAGRWSLLDETMRFFATDYVVPTTLICGLLLLWFGRTFEMKRQALLAIISLALANAIVQASNAIWFRPRPFTAHEVTLLFYHPSDSSFPSNPAATTWALAWTIWCYDRRYGFAFVALAFTMGLSRIFVGVHYPFDVLGGMIVGIVSARTVVHHLTPRLTPVLRLIITVARRLTLA